MQKNKGESDRPHDNILRRMRFAFWLIKGRDALLEYYMIYLLTAVGMTPGGSSTVHSYTQTVHRATQ